MNDKYKQIVFNVILTAIFTFIVFYGLNYFQSDKLSLAYTLDEGISFEGSFENLGIYNLRIINDGKKMIDGISLRVSFPGGEVRDVKINSDFIVGDGESYNNGEYQVSFLSLNPSEVVGISILVDISSMEGPVPDIYLRGEGVNGVLKTEDEDFFHKFAAWLAFIPIVLMGFISGFSNSFFSKKTEGDISIHSDDQRRILSYLSGICGLKEEAERYDNLPNEVSYLSESDRLSRLAMEGDRVYARKVINVFLKLLNYTSVAKLSKGVIYYNLAKIEFYFWGNTDEYKSYMFKAESFAKKIVDTRKGVDIFWKTKPHYKG